MISVTRRTIRGLFQKALHAIRVGFDRRNESNKGIQESTTGKALQHGRIAGKGQGDVNFHQQKDDAKEDNVEFENEIEHEEEGLGLARWIG